MNYDIIRADGASDICEFSDLGHILGRDPHISGPKSDIKDHKKTLNCQKDSSNTSNSMFFGTGNRIMTILEQMGHQMYLNFQNRVIF